LLALSLVASACGDDDNGDSADDNGTTTTEADGSGGDRGNVDGVLKLGSLTPQTGDPSVINEALTTPIDIAIKEINDAGGVLGQPVELAAADDGSSATVAETSYGRLVNTENVDAILGPAPSDVAAKIADRLGVDRVPACSGSTTA